VISNQKNYLNFQLNYSFNYVWKKVELNEKSILTFSTDLQLFVLIIVSDQFWSASMLGMMKSSEVLNGFRMNKVEGDVWITKNSTVELKWQNI